MDLTEEIRRALSGARTVVPQYATMANWCVISGLGRSVSYELLSAGTLRGKKVGARLLIDVPHGLAAIAAMPDAVIKVAARRPNDATNTST